jgi:hypothetical protein
MYLNENQLILWIEEAGQVESAVNNVLREYAPEYHDEVLKKIAFTAMEQHLFKGSRRAVSHISEPVRQEVLLQMINKHKKGFGFKNRNFFFTAWLETIKLLSVENQKDEIIYFIVYIVQTYIPSDHLISLVGKALILVGSTIMKPISCGIKEWENTVEGLRFESFRVF